MDSGSPARFCRRLFREVLAEHRLRKLPPRETLLLTGSQGSGKSRQALRSIASLTGDIVVWMTQPTTEKADEVAREYEDLAERTSLPVKVVRGRSANDPRAAKSEKMCLRAPVVEAAAKKGVPVHQAICKTCSLRGRCGYMRQRSELEATGASGFFVLSSSYLFLPCPAPAPQLMVIDEAVTIAAAEILSMPRAVIAQYPRFRGGGGGRLGNAITASKTLNHLVEALRTEYPAVALRDLDVTENALLFARQIVDREASDLSTVVNGGMTDEQIRDVLALLEQDRAADVCVLIDQVLEELRLGRQSFTGVVLRPAGSGEPERVTVHRLRPLRSVPRSASVLLLDGTGSFALNRKLFPGLRHEHIPVKRLADVTGTIDKSYSRQNLTGLDRRGQPIKARGEEAKRLRAEVGRIAERLPKPVLLISNKPVISLLQPELEHSANIYFAHFSAVRGLNAWEQCRSVLVIGRESISIEAAEDIARSYMASDPPPFLSMRDPVPADWPWQHWPYLATRGRRMADGTVRPVTTEVHPDPRVQEVLEQIREAEVVQAADRVRPIYNERTFVLMNNLVLDVTYTRTLRHADLVAGGTRWERAVAAQGVLPLGASDLHAVHPDLFPSVESARLALKRDGLKWGHNPNINNIWKLTPFVYRRQGRSGKASRVLVDTARHADPRAAVEALLGALVWFVAAPAASSTSPGGETPASTAEPMQTADPAEPAAQTAEEETGGYGELLLLLPGMRSGNRGVITDVLTASARRGTWLALTPVPTGEPQVVPLAPAQSPSE